jgi:hypothetical protein
MTCDSVNDHVMPKLTLHIPEELVTTAKIEAANRHVSVSKLVSDFFTSLAAHKSARDSPQQQLAPRTRRLAGCIPATDEEKEDYIDHLERKHS